MTDEPSPAAEQSVPLIIGAVAITLLLASLGQTIVSTALPTIVGELGGLDHLTWVVTAYLLSSTVVAPIYGKLGDLFGRKIVLQVAIITFLIGSVGAGLAGDMTTLIVARVVQGLGGGGLLVVAMTVVADVIPPRQRGRIQGVFGAVFGVSTILGPLLGGFLVEHASWHWIFFANVPVGLLAFAIISIAFRARPERVSHRIDYLGAATLAGALSAIVLYTSLGGTTFPWDAPAMIAMLIAALVFLAAFVLVESRAAEPILPLSLFRNNNFVVLNAVGFIVGIAMFGSITFLPLYLQVVQGVSPTTSGLSLLPMMLGLIGTSTLAGMVMSRTGRYRWLPLASTALLFLAMALLSTMNEQTGIGLVSLYMFMAGAGIGPVMSVGITAIQNAVNPRDLGVATASATMFRQIGGSIGVSVFGAIFTNRLAAQLGGDAAAGGIGSFAGPAVARLPEPLHTQMVHAFVVALSPVFVTAAAAAVVAFALGWLLREVPLALSLRAEPQAEIDAEEEAAAAVAGAPATAPRM